MLLPSSFFFFFLFLVLSFLLHFPQVNRKFHALKHFKVFGLMLSCVSQLAILIEQNSWKVVFLSFHYTLMVWNKKLSYFLDWVWPFYQLVLSWTVSQILRNYQKKKDQIKAVYIIEWDYGFWEWLQNNFKSCTFYLLCFTTFWST